MRDLIVVCGIFGLVCSPALSSDFHDALKARRDRDAFRLEQGLADERVFEEVKMIDRKFHEESRTVRLFHALDEKHPAFAKRCFRHVRDELLAGNTADRALFFKHNNDLMGYISQRINIAVQTWTILKSISKNDLASQFDRGVTVKKLSATASRLALVAEESGDLMTADALRRIEPKMNLFFD